ncbi:hypothetical protein FRC03_004759 [Tulasnella sp. 419]|nr:hypothetical protein FRC03_004759 [Tulasnella sp. 419]
MATASITSIGSDDPLQYLLRPPRNESPADRSIRLRKEAEAKRRSDQIDEEIKAARENHKKKKTSEIRLLLLGQSSSGKSTLQKQFQLLYAPSTLDLERTSWQPVVYINLVKSIRTILEALEFEYDNDNDAEDLLPIPPISPPSPTQNLPSSSKGKAKDDTPPSPISNPSTPAPDSPAWSQQLATLRLRLLPVLSMEEILARKIGRGVQVAPGKEEVFVRNGWQGVRHLLKQKERAANPADAALLRDLEQRARTNSSTSALVTPTSTTTSEYQYHVEERDEMIKQVAKLLAASKEDVENLWKHQSVKTLIKKRRLRLEESSLFFLDNLDRIARTDYSPSDDDILRARIRTMGVSEHLFEVPTGTNQKVINWRLYDVGGARGQRPSWVPYFEDANAIIFLAPISAFDQYLEEDGKTNRVDDSLQLFTLICSNPLLKNVHLVLFLNKTDVLKKKLAMGIKVKKYITSYGDRPNEYGAVSAYFVAHFKQVHRKNNVDAKRELYTHLTSVVDTKTTRNIIMNVRDAIFRVHLKESSML